MLDEVHGKVPELRQIQTVKPDHWTRAVLSVIVVIPRRSYNHITTLHGNTAAMNSRETTFTLNDESHGERCVAMCRSGLIWHDQLESGVNGVRSIWCLLL